MLANWNSSRPYSRRLRILQHAALIEVAGLEGQLALDDAGADRLVPLDLDRSDVGELARLGGEGERRALSVRAVVLAGLDLRVRIAVILQLVERQLAGRHDQLAVARRADLQRHLVLQRLQVLRRNDIVEADEVDGRNPDRFPFGDRDGDVDRVLFVVQLDVEAGDARVRDIRGRRRTPEFASGRRRTAPGRRMPSFPRAAWRSGAWRARRAAAPRRPPVTPMKSSEWTRNRAFFLTAGGGHEQAREDDAEDTSPHGGSLEPQRVPEYAVAARG